jgi:hypothetical protein
MHRVAYEGASMRLACVCFVMGLGPLSGCITFNGKELPKVEPNRASKERVVVAVEVDDFERTHNGKHGDLGRLNEGSLGRGTANQIARFWKQKDLIDDFGFPGDLDEEPTHRLVMSGSVNETSSITSAILTGVTLYLIPSSAHTTYDLKLRLDRLDGDKVAASYEVIAKNSITFWQGLVFLPVTPLGSLIWGTYGADRDRALFAYQELCEQGAFGEVARCE